MGYDEGEVVWIWEIEEIYEERGENIVKFNDEYTENVYARNRR